MPKKSRSKERKVCSEAKAETNETNEFLVERIVAKRLRNGNIEYFVKWLSYPDDENTWEPIDNLLDECHHMIREYETEEQLLMSGKQTDSTCQTSVSSEPSLSSKACTASQAPKRSVHFEPDVNRVTNMTSAEGPVIAVDRDVNHTESDTTEDSSEESMTEEEDNDSGNESESKSELKSNTPDVQHLKPSLSTGFPEGLHPKEILSAASDGQQIYFLMQWSNSEEPSVVLAKEANIRCPQIVIQFYEKRIYFD